MFMPSVFTISGSSIPITCTLVSDTLPEPSSTDAVSLSIVGTASPKPKPAPSDANTPPRWVLPPVFCELDAT